MGTTGSESIGPAAGSTRRDFLKAGGLGTLGLGLGGGMAAADPGRSDGAVILLMMVGGPSQIETFDPKPDAPAEVRGPFRSIASAVPGLRVSEHLPEVARRMGGLTLVRSLNHDAAPIHETGHQLLGTGGLCGPGLERPHLGSVAARRLGASGGLPPFVILPGPIGPTGVEVSHGQSSGPLGASFAPFVLGADPASPGFDPSAALDRARRFLDRADALASAGAPARSPASAFDLGSERPSTLGAYGRSSFGRSCLLARKLVEGGARVVVVNMFETVFNRPSWDAHGSGPFSTLGDYADRLLPDFDRGFSALVDDLEARGLLDSTLVVASGEFGRTPRINQHGGRDHWPGAWSALLAGGGTAGGRAIGATDAHASAPSDRPVAPAELVATMAKVLGLTDSIEGASPILEAFA